MKNLLFTHFDHHAKFGFCVGVNKESHKLGALAQTHHILHQLTQSSSDNASSVLFKLHRYTVFHTMHSATRFEKTYHFKPTYWLEERQCLLCWTMEDWTSFGQQRQSVKQLEDGEPRLVNGKYNSTTTSRQSTTQKQWAAIQRRNTGPFCFNVHARKSIVSRNGWNRCRLWSQH